MERRYEVLQGASGVTVSEMSAALVVADMVANGECSEADRARMVAAVLRWLTLSQEAVTHQV
jgi:DNA polymerase III psi subunit